MLHALSFDIEEWYHAELVRRRVTPVQRVSQVEQACAPILDLLARRKQKATFFIVGEVVREHPALVQAIQGSGHEIGCHTMSHRPLWDMTPSELASELREFRALLTDSADNVIGFRAPTFSLVARTAWALEVLRGEGFRYDASIFPAANHVYGLNGGPLDAYKPDSRDLRRRAADGPLVEMPMTVWETAGLRLPVSGGFYLRVLPLPVLMHALRQVSRTRPIVLYLHPWEAYPDTPVVPGLPVWDRAITYYGRSSALRKLERILDVFPFARLRDVLEPEWSLAR
jgi:peptidoglycan-N-acetylglucosamine deacetylase